MRSFLLILIGFWLTACSPETNIDNKILNWNSVLTNEIPIGSSKSQIIKWFRVNDIVYGIENKKQQLVAVLEVIEDPNPVCSGWTIFLRIQLDGLKSIENNIEKHGNACE